MNLPNPKSLGCIKRRGKAASLHNAHRDSTATHFISPEIDILAKYVLICIITWPPENWLVTNHYCFCNGCLPKNTKLGIFSF